MIEISTYLINYISAFTAFMAGVFWLRSTLATAEYDPNHPDNLKNPNYLIILDHHKNDLIRLLPIQNKLNRIAAFFAASAAFLQAIGLTSNAFI